MLAPIDSWVIFVVGGIDAGAIMFWAFFVNFQLMERESDRYASALLDAAGVALEGWKGRQ